MGALVAEPETAGADPGDIAGEVLKNVLAEVLSTPWLIGLLVLLAIGKLVQLGRVIVHGQHGRDPRRTFPRAEKAELLERAGHRCEHHSWLLGRCRETEALQADHVHPHSRGGTTVLENGQAFAAGTTSGRRRGCRGTGNWPAWKSAGRPTSHRASSRPLSAVDRPCVRSRGDGSAGQRRPLEHLLPVPDDVPLRRQGSARTGPQSLAVQVIDGSPLRRSGGEALRHDDGEVVGKAEHAAVEQLVVQRAEREPVVEIVRVRAAQLEPADVRRLDPENPWRNRLLQVSRVFDVALVEVSERFAHAGALEPMT